MKVGDFRRFWHHHAAMPVASAILLWIMKIQPKTGFHAKNQISNSKIKGRGTSPQLIKMGFHTPLLTKIQIENRGRMNFLQCKGHSLLFSRCMKFTLPQTTLSFQPRNIEKKKKRAPQCTCVVHNLYIFCLWDFLQHAPGFALSQTNC